MAGVANPAEAPQIILAIAEKWAPQGSPCFRLRGHPAKLRSGPVWRTVSPPEVVSSRPLDHVLLGRMGFQGHTPGHCLLIEGIGVGRCMQFPGVIEALRPNHMFTTGQWQQVPLLCG